MYEAGDKVAYKNPRGEWVPAIVQDREEVEEKYLCKWPNGLPEERVPVVTDKPLGLHMDAMEWELVPRDEVPEKGEWVEFTIA